MKGVSVMQDMQEYEYITATSLRSMLKEKVRGKVWVRIHDDRLHVKIDYNDLSFGYVECKMSSKISSGIGPSDLLPKIVDRYKEFIFHEYFKK